MATSECRPISRGYLFLTPQTPKLRRFRDLVLPDSNQFCSFRPRLTDVLILIYARHNLANLAEVP